MPSRTSTTTPDWSLRPAREDDREFLRRLHELSYRPHVEQVWGWDDAQQREFFDRRFRPERLQVVESGGEPVGVLSIGEEENALFLADVEIAPEWQRRGIGSAIVRSLQERARAEGRPLELQVLRVNERARALYERLGFREIRHDEIRARMRWPSENVLSPDEGDLSPL